MPPRLAERAREHHQADQRDQPVADELDAPGVAQDGEAAPAEGEGHHGHDRDGRHGLEEGHEPRDADRGAQARVAGEKQRGHDELAVARADRVEHAVEEGDPGHAERGARDLAATKPPQLARQGLVQLTLRRVDPREHPAEPLGLRLAGEPPDRADAARPRRPAGRARLRAGLRRHDQDQGDPDREPGRVAVPSPASDPAAHGVGCRPGLVPHHPALHGVGAEGLGLRGDR